eukprot:scaffold123177_cov63-Phaeocystis_antarctica.AAC.4
MTPPEFATLSGSITHRCARGLEQLEARRGRRFHVRRAERRGELAALGERTREQQLLGGVGDGERVGCSARDRFHLRERRHTDEAALAHARCGRGRSLERPGRGEELVGRHGDEGVEAPVDRSDDLGGAARDRQADDLLREGRDGPGLQAPDQRVERVGQPCGGGLDGGVAQRGGPGRHEACGEVLRVGAGDEDVEARTLGSREASRIDGGGEALRLRHHIRVLCPVARLQRADRLEDKPLELQRVSDREGVAGSTRESLDRINGRQADELALLHSGGLSGADLQCSGGCKEPLGWDRQERVEARVDGLDDLGRVTGDSQAGELRRKRRYLSDL